MALRDGLFRNFAMTPSFEANGFYTHDDFMEFGRRIGLMAGRIPRLLYDFETEQPAVADLVDHSFLSPHKKSEYLSCYRIKVRALGYRYGG